MTMPSSDQAAPRGRLIVVAAPSGAGKTTLVHRLLERTPDIEFSISYTTRPRRDSEVDGRDYFFIDEDEFGEMVRRDEFLEHANVFDHWYGTGRDYVERRLRNGRSVLLEIDWQGARQVRARAPEALTVFVLPPSLAELERRLRGRASDSEDTIRRRLRDARDDISHWHEFGYVVINDDAEAASAALAAILAGGGDAHRTDSPAVRRAVERTLGPAGADEAG